MLRRRNHEIESKITFRNNCVAFSKTISANKADRKTFFDYIVKTGKLTYAMDTEIHELNLSEGNAKYISTDETKFLIWNMTSMFTCPFSTEHCRKKCYAIKAEVGKSGKMTVLSRTINFLESLNLNFVQNMIATIENYLRKPSYQKAETIIVRIHESGDFYNQKYANDWLEIINHFKAVKKLHFIAYTKSFRYFDGKTLPKALKLMASEWDDTKAEEMEIVKRNGWKIYTAVKSFQELKEGNYLHCRCEDCATCGFCIYHKYKKNVACVIH